MLSVRTYTRKKLQMQEIEDMQSLCRLCLGKTEEMISIFHPNVDDVFSGLRMRINMCLGLEVSRDDALPKYICEPCNKELDKFYTFKKNCTASYRKLKASLFAVKQKKNDNESNDIKTIGALILNNNEKTNVNDNSVDSSQTVKENEMIIELPTNMSPLEDENFVPESVRLNDIETNITRVTEQNRETEDHLLTPNTHGATKPITHDLLTNVVIDQEFVNVGQLDEVSNNLDVTQAQEDNKNVRIENIKTVQCLPEFIVTALVDKGVLAKRDDALEVLDQSINTFNLETPCGSEIIMELVEEEPEMPTDVYNKSPHPKIFDPHVKSDARWCGTCGGRFSSRGALVRHQRVHSGEKPFACRTCGRRFAQREVLRRHELLHSDKLPYQCASCPKAYTQRGALDAHARSHASPAARPLVLHRCSRCPKVFLYPSGLSRHMSVHQGRDYPCDECSRTFNDKSSLQRHRRAHQRARAR